MPVAKISAAITASHLTFTRNGEDVLHDFSFTIAAGDYVGVIGPNGGGKTTLLRLLLGLLQPTNGSITLLGGKTTETQVRRHVGYVPQRGGSLDAQFPATVEEVVRSWRHGAEAERHIAEAMHDMGIEKLAARPMSRLSGGERQKVMLARAMAGNPSILFLDEPVDGLDPASRDAFYALLRTINAKGVTIIFVSHDVHAIAQEASSAICLKHQLVCHSKKACHIDGEELRDLFHSDRHALLDHHDT